MTDEREMPVDRGRILIVDDHPTNIDVLYDYLSDLGYEVLVAEDGRSALERIAYAHPDIILLDIMMPDLDGFETCRALKADPVTQDIPVIFVTALGGISDKIRGFETGAVDYITKPYQNQEVLARVRTHLMLKRLQGELAEKLEEARMQNEALDAYAHTVSHDLKNPLNLILNFTRLVLEDEVLSTQGREDLEHVVQSAERMNHIIQDLLLLAQVRKGQLKTERLDVAKTVEAALARLKRDLEANGAAVEVPDVWIPAWGQPAWVEAVWVNYISNAVKYGGEPPVITLMCREDDAYPGFVRYGVKDNGKGIPKHEQLRVFEEFSRVGEHRVEGHGVGLSIVRRIVSRLGGRVWVESNPDGTGCTFYFTLPKERVTGD